MARIPTSGAALVTNAASEEENMCEHVGALALIMSRILRDGIFVREALVHPDAGAFESLLDAVDVFAPFFPI